MSIEDARAEARLYLRENASSLKEKNSQDMLSFLQAMRCGLEVYEIDAEKDTFKIRLTSKNDEDLTNVVKMAKTNPVAWDACVRIIKAVTDSGGILPQQLSELAVKSMQGKARRPAVVGRPRNANAMRNLAIVMAVYRAAKNHGLPKYAHGNHDGITACELVAEELIKLGVGLGPAAIETIWKEHPLTKSGR